MSKKTFMAVLISILLASMLNGSLLLNITKANPVPNEQISQPPISPTPSLTPTVSPTINLSESPTQQPTVTILLPQNDSFFNVSLGGVGYQLTYETNSTLSWVGYSIDGSDNVTVTGNSTFVHEFVSSNGYHTLTVYANDTSGNWAIPQRVTYLVNFYPDYPPTPSPSPSPIIEPSPSIPESPTWIILPIVIMGILLTIVFAKRKMGKM
jgi:hypothetical protein